MNKDIRDALDRLAPRLRGGTLTSIHTDAQDHTILALRDADGQAWQVVFSGPVEVFRADAGYEPADDELAAGACIIDALWDETWLIVALRDGRDIHIRVWGEPTHITQKEFTVGHHTANTRPGRTYRFGHPLRATVLLSLLAGLSYSGLVAGVSVLGYIPATLRAGELAGLSLLALTIVASVARYEARFAGLPWRSYERMLLIALAVTHAPLIIWHLVEHLMQR